MFKELTRDFSSRGQSSHTATEVIVLLGDIETSELSYRPEGVEESYCGR